MLIAQAKAAAHTAAAFLLFIVIIQHSYYSLKYFVIRNAGVQLHAWQ